MFIQARFEGTHVLRVGPSSVIFLLFVRLCHLLDNRNVFGDVVFPVVHLHFLAKKISRIFLPAAIDL